MVVINLDNLLSRFATDPTLMNHAIVVAVKHVWYVVAIESVDKESCSD